MPSANQRAAGDGPGYDSEPKKMLSEKNDMTIAALIRGIVDPDRAQAYYDAEVELAEDEDREPRSDVAGACYRKMRELEDG